MDWPSRDVPESLARAGYAVFVKGGPGGSDFSEYRVQGGEVVARRTGEQPTGADLLSAYRPLRELPQLIDLLRGLGTAAVAAAATTVQAAGLAWVAGQPILTVLAGIGR